jgi:F-type H+-transporting ATPase subunit b
VLSASVWLALAYSNLEHLAPRQTLRAQKAQREQAAREIEQQKQAAMATLETQVDTLSNQILEKLLGSALAK